MSKANQAFNNNDEAVSPVIGVILMVAITVVLAAVVFVLVSNLGEGAESAPNVTFSKNSSERTLTVTTAETADWDDFSMAVSGVSGCTASLSTGGSSTYSAGALPAESVDAGDVISLTGTCAGASFRLTHSATNSLVYSTTF